MNANSNRVWKNAKNAGSMFTPYWSTPLHYCLFKYSCSINYTTIHFDQYFRSKCFSIKN